MYHGIPVELLFIPPPFPLFLFFLFRLTLNGYLICILFPILFYLLLFISYVVWWCPLRLCFLEWLFSIWFLFSCSLSYCGGSHTLLFNGSPLTSDMGAFRKLWMSLPVLLFGGTSLRKRVTGFCPPHWAWGVRGSVGATPWDI